MIGQVRYVRASDGANMLAILHDDLSWECDAEEVALVIETLINPVITGPHPIGLEELTQLAEMVDGVVDYFAPEAEEKKGRVY